ncbi:MAG: hypothetical protein FJ279_02180 [Planctomycetes bacterium]|nr:hypothetical protein [Planctomycetota bacterium]
MDANLRAELRYKARVLDDQVTRYSEAARKLRGADPVGGWPARNTESAVATLLAWLVDEAIEMARLLRRAADADAPAAGEQEKGATS